MFKPDREIPQLTHKAKTTDDKVKKSNFGDKISVFKKISVFCLNEPRANF